MTYEDIMPKADISCKIIDLLVKGKVTWGEAAEVLKTTRDTILEVIATMEDFAENIRDDPMDREI
jgi:hypothetical protein